MSDLDALRRELLRIDGRSYGFYKDLRGKVFDLGAGRLCFDHIQGDPFASPSRLSLVVGAEAARLPKWALASCDARRATADYVQRAFASALAGSHKRTGSGKSGLLEIARCGQEVLERTGVRANSDATVEVRVQAGLPAQGRRIRGRAAGELLCDRLPQVLASVWDDLDADALQAHVHAVEDQVALRAALHDHGLIAFLAEGAQLPRRTGADTRPLPDALPLEVPESLEVELEAPHAGRLRGLGIPKGVTLIVGGGYHGKSTVLSVLALGVYDHLPGDGRDRCVTCDRATTIRAEDGRAVRGVDLRPFINDLPLGRRTDRFDTDDASGSTSQAAAIVEALELGARALLIDEDTAATNFMIRDARMRRLIPAKEEPITPFLDRVRQLHDEAGVSSVLVLGGAGDYLDVADTVIQMEEYRPRDVSLRARQVAAELPLGEASPRAPGPLPPGEARVPDPRSLDPSRGKRAERVRSVRTRTIEFGSEEIDTSLLYQLVDAAQCRAIGDVLLELARGECDGKRNVAELLDHIDQRIETEGLQTVAERGFGDRARPRRFEVGAALNRLRSLRLVK